MKAALYKFLQVKIMETDNSKINLKIQIIFRKRKNSKVAINRQIEIIKRKKKGKMSLKEMTNKLFKKVKIKIIIVSESICLKK